MPHGRHSSIVRAGMCVLAAIAVLAAGRAFGADPDIDAAAGTRAAAFVKAEAGARAAGLSGAYSAMVDDVYGLFANPAGLVAVQRKELAGAHEFGPGGISHEAIAYGQRLSDAGVLAASFRGVFASIERRSADTLDPEGDLVASAYAIGLTYAHEFGDIAVGGSVIGLQERFADDNESGIAFDAGAVWRRGRFSAGAAALNVGPDLGDAPLPFRLRIGVTAALTEKGPVVLADAVFPDDDFTSLRLGIEHSIATGVAVRGGYHITTGESTAKGFAFGIGLSRAGDGGTADVNFRLDYAFVPSGDSGDSHRAALIAIY